MNSTVASKEHSINNSFTCTLSNEQRDFLFNELNQIPYDPTGNTDYITKVRAVAMQALPTSVVKLLSEQKTSLKPAPYIIFENLPTDEEVRFTPDSQDIPREAKSGYISENLIIAIGSLIGEPYSMFHEGKNIVNNLIPSLKAKKEYTGLGSEFELDFHIENAALKFMGSNNFSPSGLLLTGVNNDPKKPLTRLSDARKALSLLSEQDIEQLSQPLYRIKVPYRWRVSTPIELQETSPSPIITGTIDLPEVTAAFYPDMVAPINDLAATALDNFRNAIREVSIGIDVTPGRLVYINNRFTFHSRDAFTPTLDKSGNPVRWLQRIFIAPDLWNHRTLEPVKDRVFKLALNH
ncbi:TauD/TfdA family dioxygenase [Priestia megaterium]|uniref:TauD/TfdA family dioxygenase n=1 Tax=Priestia megaterium TaxID=1404 RepID=UPI003672C40C